MYNIKAFERTRVLYITNSDDLHGFYLHTVHSRDIDHTQDDGSSLNHMKTDRKYWLTIGLIFGVILLIFGIGGALTGY